MSKRNNRSKHSLYYAPHRNGTYFPNSRKEAVFKDIDLPKKYKEIEKESQEIMDKLLSAFSFMK